VNEFGAGLQRCMIALFSFSLARQCGFVAARFSPQRTATVGNAHSEK
jgi:hypothetical protein